MTRFEALNWFVFFGLLVGILCALFWLAHKESKTQQDCAQSCGIMKSRIIENACHCRTVKGWEIPQ